jgi:hypothetical protein
VIVGSLFLCCLAVQIQYSHQNAYVKQRLSEAHQKLFRGIMAREAKIQTEELRKIYMEKYEEF